MSLEIAPDMTGVDRRTRRFARPDQTWVACAICGGTETDAVYVKFDLVIGRCRTCGLTYANPRAAIGEITKRYSADYFWNEYLPNVGAPGGRVDLDAMDRHHYPIVDLVTREAGSVGRMLEIGTGAGMFLKAAQRAGWDVVGIELSAEAAKFARSLGLDVREETAERMTVEPGSVDAAVMFDTIEHLFDPLAVMQAVHRALKPRGVLVLSTPNLNALSRLALGVDWAILSPAEHLYYFTDETLMKLLRRAGFDRFRFERGYPFGPVETMNPANTHRPKSWRAAAYRTFVKTLGGYAWQRVRARGLADQLICVARPSVKPTHGGSEDPPYK